ncbi:hypothetical protein H310_08686 [Aphanomyces invadans]|uniref:AAA+ ATPase domain-containing protein n=1 Tax=Aphanomyces invadans TaxID=157072 RepID=A0A024TYY9_9STRA|nr:hypothetical protein H310_08686 [Aphanomyces invadans]ETV98562.1 hypothetical protein H310_08686 [Aphanomyces invadans]|eukprot:XP_008872759.1 hypothetical protein H310_08686 [Aphanomyces invadans]
MFATDSVPTSDAVVQVEVRRLVAEALKTLEVEPLFPLTYLQGELCSRVPLGMTLATFTAQVKDGMLAADHRLRFNDGLASFWLRYVPTPGAGGVQESPEPAKLAVDVPSDQDPTAASVMDVEVSKFTSNAIRWITANGTPYHVADIVGKTKSSPLPGVTPAMFAERIVQRMKQDSRLKYAVDARDRRVFMLRKNPSNAVSSPPTTCPLDKLHDLEALWARLLDGPSTTNRTATPTNHSHSATHPGDALVRMFVATFKSKILYQLQQKKFRHYWVDVIAHQTRRVVCPYGMTHDQLVNRIVQGVIAHKELQLEVDHRGKLLISLVGCPYGDGAKPRFASTAAGSQTLSIGTAVATRCRAEDLTPTLSAKLEPNTPALPGTPTPQTAQLVAATPTSPITVSRIDTVFTAEELGQALKGDRAFHDGTIAMHVVDVKLDGESEPRHLVALATPSTTYTMDCDSVGAANVLALLGPVLANPAIKKISFDLHQSIPVLNKFDLHVQGMFDMQLYMELQTGNFDMDMDTFMKTLPVRAHSPQTLELRPEVFGHQPHVRHVLERLANDAALLLRGYTLTIDDKGAAWVSVQAASDARVISAVELCGQRELVYYKARSLRLVSLELLATVDPCKIHQLSEHCTRVGRSLHGLADGLLDILLSSDANVLVLGEPRCGKTTMLQDVARVLSETRTLRIVSTKNDFAGDDDALQPFVMACGATDAVDLVQVVSSHTPQVLIVDELCESSYVDGARACKQHWVRLIASAPGNLRDVVESKQLQGLVGVEPGMAGEPPLHGGEGATALHRRSMPVFDVIVELQQGQLNAWGVVHDVAAAVDDIVKGKLYKTAVRSKKGHGLTARRAMR